MLEPVNWFILSKTGGQLEASEQDLFSILKPDSRCSTGHVCQIHLQTAEKTHIPARITAELMLQFEIQVPSSYQSV